MGGVIVLSMRKSHAWVEMRTKYSYLSDRGAKLKVDSLIMGGAPVSWTRSSYINLIRMWWKTLVVVSPRLVPTWSTLDSRQKHWLARLISTKYHHICGSTNSEVMLHRCITLFRWCRQKKAGLVAMVVVGETVRYGGGSEGVGS